MSSSRVEEIRKFSHSFLSNLAQHMHKELLRAHKLGKYDVVRCSSEVRQAWIRCGRAGSVQPEDVAILEEVLSSVKEKNK